MLSSVSEDFINALYRTVTTYKIVVFKFPFIGEIAKPAEPVNGQDERRINAPSLTASPVFVDG